MIYDIKKINKEIDKLKMPVMYRNRIVNLEKFFTHDITMQISIRKDAGKTTQSLILALVIFKLYDCATFEYGRIDKTQTTRANVESLFDVILNCGYIPILFNNEYNTIIYKQNEKKFYLAFESENKDTHERVIEYTHSKALCHVSSLEEWIKYKSTYNNPTGLIYILDEFMDTSRSTQRQMIELQNNISTFSRGKYEDDFHVLMLGNNIDKYNFWWEEFTIEKEISSLNFGGYISKKTELGTTFYCEMLTISDEQKKLIKNKKIRFSGFNTPKMGAFNGIESWQGSSHPHIPELEMLDRKSDFNRIWIRHRNRFIRVNLYFETEEKKAYSFLHFSNEPRKKDGIILTLDPLERNELYGFGKNAKRRKVIKILNILKYTIDEETIYFQSNSVGDLFCDFIKEIK